MADKKITELTLTTSPVASDLVELCVDPGGTPDNKKATLTTIASVIGTLLLSTFVAISELGAGVATLLAGTPSGTGGLAGTTSPTITTSLTLNGTLTQTSTSATAVSIGPNGAANPVLSVVCNVASQADGVSIQGNAAGSGVTFTALSSGSNAPVNIIAKGNKGIALGSATAPALYVDQTTGRVVFGGDITDYLWPALVGSHNDYLSLIKADNSGYANLNAGNIIANAGNISVASNSQSVQFGASFNVGLSYLAAAKLALGNGSAGSVTGTLILSSIGIGTSSPTSVLHVEPNSGASPLLTFRLKDNTSTLGQTRGVVEAGQGQSTAALWHFVNYGGGTILLSVGPDGLLTTNSAVLMASNRALTDGAAAQVATMTNGPTAGNPTKWFPINDNGTTRYVPAW